MLRPRALNPFILAGTLLALLAGCASTPTPKAKPGDYASLYASGQYQAAYEESSRVAGSLRGTERQRAALIAGLSAQALNRNSDAEKWLTPLVEDPDATVAGEAGAALGLIAMERKEYAKGAKLLNAASGRLRDDDAARASMYAGDCSRALGQAPEAEAAYRKAQHLARGDEALRVMIGDRLNSLAASPPKSAPPVASAPAKNTPANAKPPTPRPQAAPRRLPTGLYAIQVGAYSTRQRALANASNYTRYGPPRIVQTQDKRGRNAYAIRLGKFRSEAQAEKFGKWIGSEAIVVPIDDES